MYRLQVCVALSFCNEMEFCCDCLLVHIVEDQEERNPICNLNIGCFKVRKAQPSVEKGSISLWKDR